MIVTFDQAKKLFKIGFHGSTTGAYWRDNEALKLFEYDSDWNSTADANGCYSAPEVHEALQWIRDERGVICAVERDIDFGTHGINEMFGYYGGYSSSKITDGSITDTFPTFPEAESALLDEILTYLEEKK